MILTLEELSANAWPGFQTVFYDGWVLRFANGYTRRANSILPLYPSRIPPDEKIGFCEEIYRQRDLPPIFKLAGQSEARELNDLLLASGYQAEADTSVQLADLRAWPAEVSPGVDFTPAQTPEWETAFCAMSGLREDQQSNHTRILAAIVPRKCFATIQTGDQVTGCALGVLQNGYLGIFDVIIHPAYHRQGHGDRLMRSLLSWGKQQGARSAYLQVMLNNAPALRLYERMGFKEQYQYWYCVKPGEQ